MESAVQAWQANLTDKVTTVRHNLLKYLLSKDDATGDRLAAEVQALRLMFSSNRIPELVSGLHEWLAHFRNAGKTNTVHLEKLMHYYFQLPSIVSFLDEQPASFDKIFESFKSDDQLNQLVDELVATLKRILKECDDTLSAHICRELEAIVAEIGKKDKLSLYELQNWVDLANKVLIFVIESTTQTRGITLIYEGVKIALRVKQRLIQGYADAQLKMIEDRKLTLTEKAFIALPAGKAEEKAVKLLEAAPADLPIGEVAAK